MYALNPVYSALAAIFLAPESVESWVGWVGLKFNQKNT
jgi:hypothetical protein